MPVVQLYWHFCANYPQKALSCKQTVTMTVSPRLSDNTKSTPLAIRHTVMLSYLLETTSILDSDAAQGNTFHPFVRNHGH